MITQRLQRDPAAVPAFRGAAQPLCHAFGSGAARWRRARSGRCATGLAASLLVLFFGFAVAEPGAPETAALDTLRLRIAGPEEVVVSADDMHCQLPGEKRGIDVTDVPPTAFRRDDGTVIMLAGNRQNFYLEGPSLDQVKRTSCGSLLPPAPKDDPAAFQDNEWLSALYSFDGKTVYGFVHNEYHGEEHGFAECQVTDRRNRACWYAATTLVVSKDGGRTFGRLPPPDNVVAALPYKFSPEMLRAGLGAPKVVGDPRDGSLYIFSTFLDRNRRVKAGQCVVRALGQKQGVWRTWDGKGFEFNTANPYDSSAANQNGDCTKVIHENIMSVKFIPARNAFVAIGIRQQEIVYSFSRDLLHWDTTQVLMPISAFALWTPGAERPVWYVSLLDPSSKSRNFDTLEETPYLYFVRFHIQNGRLVNQRRDLMRVRLAIPQAY